MTRAAEQFGAVDLLLANAGIAADAGDTLRTMDPDEFERVVEVNLHGVYRTVRAGLEHVIERRGQVMLVSSVYAFLNGVVLTPYAVAKAGVERWGGRCGSSSRPTGRRPPSPTSGSSTPGWSSGSWTTHRSSSATSCCPRSSVGGSPRRPLRTRSRRRSSVGVRG